MSTFHSAGVTVLPIFLLQRFKGKGYWKSLENDACPTYVFSHGWRFTRRPVGLTGSGGCSADCKLGLVFCRRLRLSAAGRTAAYMSASCCSAAGYASSVPASPVLISRLSGICGTGKY